MLRDRLSKVFLTQKILPGTLMSDQRLWTRQYAEPSGGEGQREDPNVKEFGVRRGSGRARPSVSACSVTRLRPIMGDLLVELGGGVV